MKRSVSKMSALAILSGAVIGMCTSIAVTEYFIKKRQQRKQLPPPPPPQTSVSYVDFDTNDQLYVCLQNPKIYRRKAGSNGGYVYLIIEDNLDKPGR